MEQMRENADESAEWERRKRESERETDQSNEDPAETAEWESKKKGGGEAAD
jgi:hypothetical protein